MEAWTALSGRCYRARHRDAKCSGGETVRPTHPSGTRERQGTAMSKRSLALLGAALFATGAHGAAVRTMLRRGEAVERHLPGDQTFTQWTRDPYRARQRSPATGSRCATSSSEQLETVKLTNVVPPIHFESGVAEIPASTVAIPARHARKHARPQERAPAPRRPCGQAAVVARARGAVTATTRVCRANARARSRSSCSTPSSSRPTRSRTSGPATSGRSRRTRPPRVARRTAASRSRSGTTSRRTRRRDARGARQERLPAGQGLPHRDRLQDALRRRPRAARARAEPRARRCTTTKRRDRRVAGVRRGRSARLCATCSDKQNVRRQVHRLHGRRAALASATSGSTARSEACRRRARAASRSRSRKQLSSPTRPSTATAAARRARSPRTTRAGARDESSHRGRVLVRRPAAGTARRAAALSGDAGRETVDACLRPAVGRDSRRCSSTTAGRSCRRATSTSCSRALADVADKTNARLRFVGYTGNERLDRRTALDLRRRHRAVGGARAPRDGDGRRRSCATPARRPSSKVAATCNPMTS